MRIKTAAFGDALGFQMAKWTILRHKGWGTERKLDKAGYGSAI
ncbi:MAG TPA: hypothetical protein VFH95_16105 [Candidatus Kapabacteria bacterium]|nr:hypothetical protein [Candidatus Kapabacteria bacterium]